jgi:hypothetical protein
MVSLPHAAHIGVYLSTIENTAQNDCERGDPAYDTNDRKDDAAPRHSFHSHSGCLGGAAASSGDPSNRAVAGVSQSRTTAATI